MGRLAILSGAIGKVPPGMSFGDLAVSIGLLGVTTITRGKRQKGAKWFCVRGDRSLVERACVPGESHEVLFAVFSIS